MKRKSWLVIAFAVMSNFCLCFAAIQYPIKGISGETLLSYGVIFNAELSPDGKYLATVSSPGAFLWEIQTGELVHYYPIPDIDNAYPCYLTFSPNGNYLLLKIHDQFRRIYLLDVQSGELIKSLSRPEYLNYAISFFPNSKEVLLSQNTGSIIYDIFAEKITREYSSIPQSTSNAISPDGKFIAQIEKDSIILYDAATKAVVATLNGASNTSSVKKISISPNNQYVMIPGYIWDRNSSEPLHQFPDWEKSSYEWVSYSFTPDNKQVLIASMTGSAVLYDIQTWNPTATFSMNSIVTQNAAKTNHDVGIVNPYQSPIEETPSPVKPFCPLPEWLVYAGLTADGKNVVTCDGGISAVWDLSTKRIVRSMNGHNYLTREILFSPDGNYAASFPVKSKTINVINIWDLKTGKPLYDSLLIDMAAHTLEFSPDSQSFLLPGSFKSDIYSTQSGTLIRSVSNCALATYSPDGTAIVGIKDNTEFVVINPTTGETIRAWKGVPENPIKIKFLADGKRILVHSYNFDFSVWNIETGEKLSSFTYANSQYFISADTRSIFFSRTKEQVLYDVETSTFQKAFDASLASFAFSTGNKGYWLDSNYDLYYWDGSANTKMNLDLNEIAISNDGKYLVGWKHYGAIGVWNVADIKTPITDWSQY